MKARRVAPEQSLAPEQKMAPEPKTAPEPKAVDYGELIGRRGLKYEVDSKTPFTGKAVAYWSNGQKETEIEFFDGKKHGKVITWYENGQKGLEHDYRDGQVDGEAIHWYRNGRKKSRAEYRNGVVIKQECWDEDGNPQPCLEDMW